MLTLEFTIFVCAALVIYYLLRGRAQNVFLLGASYAIYAYWDIRFLLLLVLTTTATYLICRQLKLNDSRRRSYLAVGLLLDIGVLLIFKYSGFFIQSTVDLLARFHVSVSAPMLQIILPLGISFYTFRQLAYLLDVYNGRIDRSSWLNYSLYVAFFPQIISGPIERPAPFLKALEQTRRIDQSRFLQAAAYIFIGLYYKIAIADPLVGVINDVFSNVGSATSADALKAIILYSIQLYADFAGYSAVAIGVSRLFDLPAMDNFRQPYFSQTVIEFWTRWHISLSFWFRDYLFFPLSRYLLKRWGNQRAVLIQSVSYLVTMLATGLWHGASWTFVFWGLLHGIYLSLEGIIARLTVKVDRKHWQKWLNIVANVLLTQVLISTAWVFFRAATFNDALVLLKQAVAIRTMPDIAWWVQILVPVSMLLLVDGMQVLTRTNTIIWNTRLVWRAVFMAVLILALYIFWGKANAPFIYLRF